MDYPPRMAGGTTIHTYQMARAFASLGHRPYVVAARAEGAPNIEHGEIEIRRVARPYTVTSALEARRLRTYLDVFHGHGTCSYGFMRTTRYPIAVKMHSTWKSEYERYRRMGKGTGLMPLYVRMDRYCARHADAVIAISEVIKAETISYGVPPEKITVIHNGIDAEPFRRARPHRNRKVADDAVVVGYIGRLVPHKGVLLLAQAFTRLALRYENLHLLVVGDGPERARMEAILRPFHSRTQFTGYVPHRDVPSYYASVDIVVYPTLYEPLGNVILESMAAGKPIIASRTGGIPEIFCEKAGILVDPPPSPTQGSKELEDAIEYLILSPELRKSMGRSGIEAAATFSWERVCRRTIEVLEGVLKR